MPPSSSDRRQSLDMTTRAVVLGVTAILIGLPLAGWFFFVSHMARDGHADFRATYTAGYLLRTGQPLYDYGTELQAQNQQISVEPIAMPFIHPAYEALIYAPLSFLGYHAAYWIFFGINVLLLRLLCRILAPELSLLSSIAPALPAATLLAFLPIGASLVQGQDSIILLLIFAIVFARFRGSSNLFISGAIFGLGAFRFQLVLPILLCFAIWRRWKFVAGFSLIASACACVSVQLAGFWPYFRTINGLVSGPYIHAFQPIEHMPNLHGLIVAIGGGKQWVVTLSLFVLAFAVVTGIGRNMQQQFSIAITAALLVSYYGLIHDVSILFIPLTFLIGQNKLSIAVIGFLTPVLIIFAPEHFYFAAIGLLGLLWLLCWRVGQFGQGKVGCDKLEVSVSSATLKL